MNNNTNNPINGVRIDKFQLLGQKKITIRNCRITDKRERWALVKGFGGERKVGNAGSRKGIEGVLEEEKIVGVK